MGEALYAQLSEDHPALAYRTYAPVGSHRDLLAYLVRRLLENGANTSFVALAADDAVPVATLLRRPADSSARRTGAASAHPAAARSLPAAAAQFARHRIRRARGAERSCSRRSRRANRRIPMRSLTSTRRPQALRRFRRAQRISSLERGRRRRRARNLERAADLLEQRARALHRAAAARGRQDARRCASEVREAVDFCRYYAAKAASCSARTRPCRARPARATCSAARPWRVHRDIAVEFSAGDLPGPVAAALMAGNAVIAKPAEQTPLIAAEAMRLLHEAGIPPRRCIWRRATARSARR